MALSSHSDTPTTREAACSVPSDVGPISEKVKSLMNPLAEASAYIK
jgi:hypothetical protein